MGERETIGQLVKEVESLRQRLVQLDASIPVHVRAYQEAPIGLCYFDTDLRYVQINDWLAAINGMTVEEHLGYTIGEVLPGVVAAVESQLRQVIETGEPIIRGKAYVETPAHPGTKRHYEHNYYPDKAEDGRVVGVACAVEDVTERLRAEAAAEEALRKSEKRFRDLFEASPDAIFVEDLEGNVLDVNPAGCQLQRIEKEKLIGMNVSQLVFPESVEQAMENFKRLAKGEVEQVEGVTWTGDGCAIPVEVRVGPVEYVDKPALLVLVRDITERKEYESRLEYLARFDALTGLPNRYLFEDRLNQAIVRAKRSGDHIGLLYLDLDEFKNVNDSLGHLAGDELLRAAAGRLTELVRESDSVARLGGDEFAIIQTEVDGAAGASALALRVLEAMSLPFSVSGHEIHTSTSIGISLSSPGDEREELMLQADRALYKAKQKGRSTFHFHNEELAEEVRTYVTLRQDLHGALERGEFFLDYQPQIDLGSGRVVGSEALLRWLHPERGLLAPGAFIPVAERTGLIIPMGAWVLAEACQQRKTWSDGGLPEVPVAVNLSAVQLRDPAFTETLLRILHESGINPHLLELELTETILMEGSDVVKQGLIQWHEHGIKFTIDDFGTGYSYLQYLSRFPVHKLKIAMEFVQSVTEDPDASSIVDAVISLGHKLGLKVIAEGVETEVQVEFLRAHGCDEAQGFYFGRPVAPDAFAFRPIWRPAS